jgi:hypothetical protein
MTEVWKTIEECPKYEISDLGRVRSNTNHGKGKVLKARWHKQPNRVTYPRVALWKTPTQRVHRGNHTW